MSTTVSATPEAAELLIRLLADPAAVPRAGADTWMAVGREAARQGVLQVVCARLRRLPEGTVPAHVMSALTERYTRAALWSAVLFRELDLIVRTLAAHDIPVLLLKGLHLAADVYEEPALRTMSDLDILVPRARLVDANRALAAAGFAAPEVGDIDEYCRTHSHLPRMTPSGGNGVGVEVHWTIELPTSPFDIRVDELWSEARTIEVKGRTVRVLAPEHLLLHLCLHACYHHRFSHTPLKQLCDIAATLQRYDGDIDWDRLAGTAERWGVQPFVRFTLLLAQGLLGARVPDAIRSFPADPDEAGLLANARAFILNNTVAVPIALTAALRSRSWTRRARAVLRNVFPPPRRLAAIYGVPRDSVRVYAWYLLRPFDLLLRNGRLTVELLLPGRAGRRMRYTEQNRAQLKSALTAWTRAARPPKRG